MGKKHASQYANFGSLRCYCQKAEETDLLGIFCFFQYLILEKR